jgi:hypothetical protein
MTSSGAAGGGHEAFHPSVASKKAAAAAAAKAAKAAAAAQAGLDNLLTQFSALASGNQRRQGAFVAEYGKKHKALRLARTEAGVPNTRRGSRGGDAKPAPPPGAGGKPPSAWTEAGANQAAHARLAALELENKMLNNKLADQRAELQGYYSDAEHRLADEAAVSEGTDGDSGMQEPPAAGAPPAV